MDQLPVVALLMLDLVLAGGMALFGWLIASSIDPGASRLQSLALAFPLGAGLFSWMMFVLSILGFPLTLVGCLGALGAAIIVLVALRVLRARATRGSGADAAVVRPTGRGRGELVALSILALLVAAGVVISIGRSYSTWDAAAIWGVKGHAVARQGSVWAASDWGAYGLGYPLNIPLQISLFAMLDGDIVPGSKLIFPFYYGSLILGLISYWRSQGRSKFAAWAALAVASLPIVFDHATQAYANLPFATYLVLGCLLAIQDQTTSRNGLSVLSGACLGLAVWTRPEGVLLVTVLCVSLWLLGRRASPPWKPGLRWFGPVLILGGGWTLFTLVAGATGIAPGLLGEAAVALFRGDLRLSSFYWIARYLARDLLQPSVWGLFLPLLAVGAVLSLRNGWAIRGRKMSPILVASAALGLPVVAFYYLVSFSGDLVWWLDTGLSRLLLPSGLLLAVWAASQWMPSRDVMETSGEDGPVDA